jgi:hypothetical protein
MKLEEHNSENKLVGLMDGKLYKKINSVRKWYFVLEK